MEFNITDTSAFNATQSKNLPNVAKEWINLGSIKRLLNATDVVMMTTEHLNFITPMMTKTNSTLV